MKAITRSTLAAGAILMLVAAAGILPASASPAADREAPRGFLGISMALVENLRGQEWNGLYIAGVMDGSPAATAGLKAQDRLLSVDGKAVRDHGDVTAALDGLRPGDTVDVVVLRGDEELSFDVVLGEEPPHRGMGHMKGPHFVFESPDGPRTIIGVKALSLNPQLAEFYGVEGGALVTEVNEDGPAWRSGIRAGDVITGWNGSAIGSLEAIHERLAAAKPGDVVDIEVRRRDAVERFPVTLVEGKDLMPGRSIFEFKGDVNGEIRGEGRLHWHQDPEAGN